MLQSIETEKERIRAEAVILFLNSGGKVMLYIVYNSDTSTDLAVTLAYELGSADMVQAVALYLRNINAETFEKCGKLPWSATDDLYKSL